MAATVCSGVCRWAQFCFPKYYGNLTVVQQMSVGCVAGMTGAFEVPVGALCYGIENLNIRKGIVGTLMAFSCITTIFSVHLFFEWFDIQPGCPRLGC